MRTVADIWYVSFSELTDRCHIQVDTLKQGIRRGSMQWQSIPDPDDRRKRLFRYDTMAPKYQTLVRRVLCGGFEPWEIPSKEPVNVLSERSLAELLEIACTNDFRLYLGHYPASDLSTSALKTQTCLARAAAIVELIGNYVIERGISQSSYAPYKEYKEWADRDNNYEFYFPKGNQYLPTNEIRLKEKVTERFGWKLGERKPIQEVVCLPRQGNKSREKFSADAELLAWITMARAHADNSAKPNEYIIRKIQEVCRITGRDVPSNGWFSQLLASPKMQQLTAKGRFGAGTKNAGRYTHSITMARAMYAGDCWMMDATRVNFIEHQTTEKGKSAFLFVIAVRDAYSGDIVGIHFDTKEDRWGYTNALKMAVKTTGYLPHTLVYDRFPGHITDEMQSILSSFERKGVQLVCTHKATGKALLERWFDTLQTVFFTNSRYYYGQGIMSTRAYNHRSPEYLVKIRKEAKAEGWDFDKAWQEAWKRVEEYRQTPVSFYSKNHKTLDLSPATLHEQSEKPNVIPVELWDQASLFWMTKVLDIRRNTISQEVHGVRYEYPIYDTQILYRYKRVAIRYEESDPTKVMLFAVGVDDRVSDFYICELTHSTAITMYGPGADKGRLAGRQAKIQAVEDQKRADLEAISNQATVDPEYLLTLGGKVSKEEYESVQTSVLFEQMGLSVAANAQKTAVEQRTKKGENAATVLPDFDPVKFVNESFFKQ